MAINEVTSIDVKTLPPFKRLIMTLGELPTSYLESMTYAELLMWFCNFLQEKVLPTINNNADALQEVITYLENLDLQDEVNNKLDEMAESGQLQEIVADYLNSKALFGYDTVADMKSATNLISGSYAKTLGYHNINDGGSATYKIREITNEDVVDEMLIISLNDDSLIAELIYENEINPEILGAYGDGTHDDTNSIKKALELNVSVKTNKIYKITETINIKNSINMENNSYFIGSNLSPLVDIAKGTQQIARNYKINANGNGNCSPVISIGSPRKCNLDLTVVNAGSIGINCNAYSSTGNNENIFTCNVIGNSNGTTQSGVLCNCFDSIFTSIVTQDCQRGVEVNNGELIANEVHSWISDSLKDTLWSNSTAVYNAGYYPQFIEWLYQDSCKYGISGIAPYGHVKYFEYNNTLTGTYTDYINVKSNSGSTRLTIDVFKNDKTESQQIKYDLGDSTSNEFGVLNKNGVTANPNQLDDYPTFSDANNAPQWGSYYVLYSVSNLPVSQNGFLKSEIIGSIVKQTYYRTIENFANQPNFYIRFRQLGSTTWSAWSKINISE